MKRSLFLALFLIICMLSWSGLALAQTESAKDSDDEPVLAYSEYTVKGYSLSAFGGAFSGAKYLELAPLGPQTFLAEGAADVVAYNGGVLIESQDIAHYGAPHKEIKSGNTYGGRLGVYIADQFHIDFTGVLSEGHAVTTMLFTPIPDEPTENYRTVVDVDEDFQVYMGGLSLIYDARPATLFHIMPRLGFGIGGIINRYSHLEDKTGLYVKGIFGIESEIVKNLSLTAQADVAVFAYDVDELGYSKMVKYTTYTVGLKWFIDVIPAPARAAHMADLSNR